MSENHVDTADTRHTRFRGHAVATATAKALGLVVLLAFLVLVSWNMFAPDMFGMETIRMKQALGIVVFSAVFVFLFHAAGHVRPDAT